MSEVVKKTIKEIGNCITEQKKLCDERNFPHFAPKNGDCYHCGKNMYQNYVIKGRQSYGKDGKELITGCPHCHGSYCD